MNRRFYNTNDIYKKQFYKAINMRMEINSVSADTRTIYPRLKFDLELYNEETEDLIFFNFSGDALIADKVSDDLCTYALVNYYAKRLVRANQT